MNIQTSTVTKLTLTEVKSLDPISVILEDIASGQGKIIIECFGKSWSAYWGGMGDSTIAEFFISCNNGYIARNFGLYNSTVEDFDGLAEHVKSYICKARRVGNMDPLEARKLFDEADDIYFSDFSTVESLPYDYMNKVFGGEWWYDIPSKANPDYVYLCRIIDAVRDALNIYIHLDNNGTSPSD